MGDKKSRNDLYFKTIQNLSYMLKNIFSIGEIFVCLADMHYTAYNEGRHIF